MFGLLLTLGLQATLPATDDVYMAEYPSAYVQIRPEESPVYLWGTFSVAETTYALGQRMHKANNPSVGLGVEFKLTPRVTGFIEGGYKHRGGEYVDFAVKEIAYTYLVSRHHVHNRPVPVDLNGEYDQESYQSTFEIDHSLVFNVGVTVAVTDALSLRAGYTFERADVLWEIYDQEKKEAWHRDRSAGYWMEDGTLKADGFSLGIQYTF